MISRLSVIMTLCGYFRVRYEHFSRFFVTHT